MRLSRYLRSLSTLAAIALSIAFLPATARAADPVTIVTPRPGELLADSESRVLVAYDLSGVTAYQPVLELRVDSRVRGSLSLTPGGSGRQNFASVPLTPPPGLERPIYLQAVIVDKGRRVAASAKVEVRVDAARRALAQLEEDAEEPVQLRYDRGVPVGVSAWVPVDGATAVERAWSYLEAYAGLYRLDDPGAQLYVDEIAHLGEGGLETDNVVFGQIHQGIPVLGAGLTVHLKEDRVIGTSGAWERDLPDLPAELLGFARAETLAAGFFREHIATYGEPRLVVYSPDLFRDPWERANPPAPAEVAWRFRMLGELATGERATGIVTVSAERGKVLAFSDDVHSSSSYDPDIDVIDANGHEIGWTCGTAWDVDYWDYETQCSENGCDNGADPDARNAFRHSMTAYDFFFDRFDFASYDGCNEQMESFIDVDLPGTIVGQYNRGCDHFKFADGATSLEVYVHEFTHGFNYKSVCLESGALNESIADTMAALVSGDLLQNTFDCTVSGRNLCFGQPDHVTEIVPGMNVWTRGMVMSRVAALLARGGTHPDTLVDVDQIGNEKTTRLWFDVVEGDHISKSSGMTRMCNELIDRADAFADQGLHDFTADDLCQVRRACSATGILPPDTDCDGIPDGIDPDLDGDGVPNPGDNCPNVFNDDQSDIDLDALGDACDPDVDGDVVANADDNCVDVANPGQEDFDGDGIGDLCDNDADGDFVPDDQDNCLMLRNFDQADMDGDEIGDMCDDDRDGDGRDNDQDVCPWLFQTDFSDSDGDGRGDLCDNCPFDANWHQADIDNDGAGDACDPDMDGDLVLNDDDNCPRDHNPTQYDGDRDGEGFECDADEWADFFLSAMSRMELVANLRSLERDGWIPLPICPDDGCFEPFEPGFTFDISVYADIPVEARILDEFGQVIARADVEWSGEWGPATSRMTLAPRAAVLSLQTAARDHVAPEYFLQLLPHPEAEGIEEVPLVIEVSQATP